MKNLIFGGGCCSFRDGDGDDKSPDKPAEGSDDGDDKKPETPAT